jgi:hypothetical protein
MLSGVMVVAIVLAATGLQLLNRLPAERRPAGPALVITGFDGTANPKRRSETTTVAVPSKAHDEAHIPKVQPEQPFVVTVPASHTRPAQHVGTPSQKTPILVSAIPPAPDINLDIAGSAPALDPYLSSVRGDMHMSPLPASPNIATREDGGVLAALQRYSRAWHNRDVHEILAVRPGLSVHTVRNELAGARAIDMSIRPTGSPNIHGDLATIECEHRVTETFNDGMRKQAPGVHMTYVLERKGGNWVIVDSH